MMAYRYRFFGLNVEANRPLSGLVAQQRAAPCDVHVTFARCSPIGHEGDGPGVSRDTPAASSRAFMWQTPAAGMGLQYRLPHGEVEFRVNAQGSHIETLWSGALRQEDLTVLLLGPVFGHVLRLRGVTVLHASAVVLDGKALAFVGRSGAGKSTTMAALVRQGCRFFSDDKLPLHEDAGTFAAPPGPGWAKLEPDAAETLYGPAHHLPILCPDWPGMALTRRLDLGNDESMQTAELLPLHRLYLLAPRSDHIERPSILKPSGRQRLTGLLPHLTAQQVRTVSGHRRDFQRLARLANSVPVRLLQRPDAIDRLDEVAAAVLHDAADGETP